MIPDKAWKNAPKVTGIVGFGLRSKPIVPVLTDDPDSRQPDRSVYWSDPPVETDWQAIAVRHSRTVADQLAVMVELREQVSSVSMDATIWKVLSLIGWSVAVLAMVWPV